MFSKFLRKISGVTACLLITAVILSGVVCGAAAQTPGAEALEAFQIEQVRASMPQLQVYVKGMTEDDSTCEAYLDGTALTSRGTQTPEENGISYLVMLDVSGSIRPEYFAAVREQIEVLSGQLGPKDTITLITFGDTVKMQLSDSRDAAEIADKLNALQARDQKTSLYEAFEQCLQYAESTSQSKRQIILVVSDGIQDTGSSGITRNEIEAQLTQASMPVFAFCVDTADRQSQEELGTFARATGGQLFAFAPRNAASVWQSWQEELARTSCLAFESSTNYADGELHTLLVKRIGAAQTETVTRQIRIKNWVPDHTAPEIVSASYDQKANAVEVAFSEPVLHAEDTASYQVRRGENVWNVKSVTKKDQNTYQLVLPEKLSAGTYTLMITDVCDDSMEKNPLQNDSLTFHKAVTLSDFWWLLVGAGVLAAGIVAALLIRKNNLQKEKNGQDASGDWPKVKVPSPEKDVIPSELLLEFVDRQNRTKQVECPVYESMIWGRSEDLCDVVFYDRRVSKQHCAFEVNSLIVAMGDSEEGGLCYEEDESKIYIMDLQSKNGTYVNGVRIQDRQALHEGDAIRLGNTIVKIKKMSVHGWFEQVR